MNISVQGCGRWGSFIAWYLDSIGHKIVSWENEGSENMSRLMKTRKNSYLELPLSVTLTNDLTFSVGHADIIVISISSQQLRNHLHSLAKEKIDGKTLVLCMKGIEDNTGLRLSEVVGEVLGGRVKTAVWVGPGHVEEFVKQVPNCMVVDSEDELLKIELVQVFSSNLIRFYYGSDLIGSEIGAASKNVIGIASGILDGMELAALKGALMARGTREISRLIKAMGGNELTAYGLTHLGDYEATVFSKHSHNRCFGESFIKGEAYHSLAEGVATSSAMMILKDKYGVELPICSSVYGLIIEGKDPQEMFSALFSRSLKGEFS